METIGNLLITGLTIGSIYGLIALAMVIVYKSTGVMNLAHGMIMVLLAYIGYFMMVNLGIPIWAAMIMIIALGGILNYIIQLGTIRPLIGEPILAIVIMTFALAYMMNGITLFAWGGRTYGLPSYIPKGVWYIAGMPVMMDSAITLLLALVLFAIVGFFFKYSKIGLGMRSVADNVMITESLGANVKRIFEVSWIMCGLIGGATAIMLSWLYGVMTEWGDFALTKALPVMLLGGLESLLGALIGGIIVGIAEVFGSNYIDPLVGGGMRDIIPFVIMLVILLFKPWGLFGWEEIERV